MIKDLWQAAPLHLAHRGASGIAPENTLAAFRKALVIGSLMVECDVHATREGAVVVMHDATVDRTTNGTGAIKELGLAELKTLDAGSWFAPEFAGEQVPTLAELLEVLRGHTTLSLEIKQAGIEEAAVASLRDGGMLDDTLVISFLPQALVRVKEIAPALPTGLLVSKGTTEEVVAKALEIGAEVLSAHRAMVNEELVGAAHSAGLKMTAWIANDRPEQQRLMDLGVEIIGTDHPEQWQSR
jgi:glycerophosphoryl diester phosphodiesterase